MVVYHNVFFFAGGGGGGGVKIFQTSEINFYFYFFGAIIHCHNLGARRNKKNIKMVSKFLNCKDI